MTDPFHRWLDYAICIFLIFVSSLSSVLATTPNISLDSVQDVTCNGAADGGIFITVLGEGPFTYLWDDTSNSTSQNLTDIGPGTYTVVVTDLEDANNTSSFSQVVNEPDSLSFSEIFVSGLDCNGNPTGSVFINGVTGGTPFTIEGGPYHFDWDWDGTPENDNYNQDLGFLSPNYDGHSWYGAGIDSLASGTYYATISDANGCELIDSTTIEPQDFDFDLIISSQGITCHESFEDSAQMILIYNGEPIEIENQLVWSNSNNSGSSETGHIYNLDTGIYIVETIPFQDCICKDTIEITQPPPFTISSETIDICCVDESSGIATISVEGGTPPYKYDWDLDGTGDFNDQKNQNSLLAGTYQFVVQDANGCLDSIEISVTEPDSQLQVTIEDVTLFCPGDSILLESNVQNNSGEINYQWIELENNNEVLISMEPSVFVDGGSYKLYIEDSLGCQAAVEYNLNDGVQETIEIDTSFASSDSIYLHNQWFYEGGFYEIILPNNVGCDSVLSIQLEEIFESCTIVSNLNSSGPGSFLNAISCAEVGAEIHFAPYLAGRKIALDDSPIFLSKDVTIINNEPEKIIIRNTDFIFSLFVLPDVEVSITGIDFQAKMGDNSQSIRNEGTLILNKVSFKREIIGSQIVPAIYNTGDVIINGDVIVH